jgi:hypothetical protein
MRTNWKRAMRRANLASFIVATALTILCGGIALLGALVWVDPLTTTQEATFRAALSLFTFGTGTLFGLIGGRL